MLSAPPDTVSDSADAQVSRWARSVFGDQSIIDQEFEATVTFASDANSARLAQGKRG